MSYKLRGRQADLLIADDLLVADHWNLHLKTPVRLSVVRGEPRYYVGETTRKQMAAVNTLLTGLDSITGRLYIQHLSLSLRCDPNE